MYLEVPEYLVISKYLVHVHPAYRWSAVTIAGMEFVKHQSRGFSELTDELWRAGAMGILEIVEMQDSGAKSGGNGDDRPAAADDHDAVAQPELPVVTPKPRRKKVANG